MMNMTEFVKVRQFNLIPRRGGGLQILSGRLFIFCIASATNPEYFEEHFLKKPKETNRLRKRGEGRHRGTEDCLMFSLCWLF